MFAWLAGRPVSHGRAGRPLHAVLLWLAMLCPGGASGASAAPVLVLPLRDAIGPVSSDYVVRGLETARQRGAPLVVIQLDTPGGLDTSMRELIQAILASPVPVAVYVSPPGARAASAGTYILYAAHVAAMAPATTLGAATPVAIGLPGSERKPPLQEPGGKPAAKGADKGAESGAGKSADPQAAKAPAVPADAMSAKQVHDAAAFIRGLAQLHGRNADWAERAVREAVSLTAEEALRDKVIDVVAADLPELLERIDGRSVRLHAGSARLQTRGLAHEVLLPDWRHRLLSVIANPSFALILMMIGIYGLIFEFSSPGFGVGGVVGTICLLLALFALQLLPVNYAGLALIVLGLGLLVAELFVPSFGVLGLGGVAAFVVGAVLLFDTDVPGFGVPLPLIAALAATSAALVLLGGGVALRARKRPVVSGREEMIGACGEVVDVAADAAWARVRGETWQVHAAGPALRPGQRVRVQAMRGLVLEVRPEPSSSTAGES